MNVWLPSIACPSPHIIVRASCDRFWVLEFLDDESIQKIFLGDQCSTYYLYAIIYNMHLCLHHCLRHPLLLLKASSKDALGCFSMTPFPWFIDKFCYIVCKAPPASFVCRFQCNNDWFSLLSNGNSFDVILSL